MSGLGQIWAGHNEWKQQTSQDPTQFEFAWIKIDWVKTGWVMNYGTDQDPIRTNFYLFYFSFLTILVPFFLILTI